MRARPFVLIALLLTSLGLFQSASAASLAQQRILYDEAKRALGKNDPAPYLRNRQALRGYPLEPHLAYDELTLRLKNASNREIETFLAEHGDLPQIGWMKLRWLRWLAERGEWQTFIKHYSPALEFTELDCLLGEYQFRHGKAADGDRVARLRVSGPGRGQAVAVHDEIQRQLVGLQVPPARGVIARGGGGLAVRIARAFRGHRRDHELALGVGEEQLDVVIRRGRIEAFQRLATDDHPAHARADLFGAQHLQGAELHGMTEQSVFMQSHGNTWISAAARR